MNIDKAVSQAQAAHDASQLLTDMIANYLHAIRTGILVEDTVEPLYAALHVTQSNIQRSTHSYVLASMQRGRRRGAYVK